MFFKLMKVKATPKKLATKPLNKKLVSGEKNKLIKEKPKPKPSFFDKNKKFVKK